MSVNEHVLALAAMAVATVAILVLGTLMAADIIRPGGPGRARRATGRGTHDGPGDRGPVVH